MGETRKPDGGRKKSKPEYDAGKNLKEQMNAAVSLYKNNSLQAIADALSINPIKARKLLITAGVCESDIAEKVQDTFEEYREAQSYKEAILSTASELKLSKASVTSYLPYEKGVYFPSTTSTEKISVGAERQRRYRATQRRNCEQRRQRSVCGMWFYSIKKCVLKPIPACRSPMKFERAEAANTQRSSGSTAGKIAKVWRGARCCWRWAM